MKLAVAQLNPTVGDLAGNTRQAIEALHHARAAGADLVLFPELFLIGYPPRDLLHREGFLDAADAALAEVFAEGHDQSIIIGHVHRTRHGATPHVDPSVNAFGGGTALQNVALFFDQGQVIGRAAKRHLPSFDVFEEERYFAAGTGPEKFCWRDLRIELSVCEDLWDSNEALPEGAIADTDLAINVSASPYYRGKPSLRHEVVATRAQGTCALTVYVNMVGGQDELVFDGSSFALRPDGACLFAAPSFTSGVYVFDTEGPPAPSYREKTVDELHHALVTGIRDYIDKNKIRGVVIGVSGGVDSAVVTALACRALGADRVLGTYLPGPHSAPSSRTQARALSEALGFKLIEIPIDPILSAFTDSLAPHSSTDGVVGENLQARIRAVLWMALANATHRVVLAGGNKSELATGYTTLYGDTVGALAPIGDLLKREVYELAAYINEEASRAIIPLETLQRPPSAELRPGQRDDQDLPPYKVLDALVDAWVARNAPSEELRARFAPSVVDDFARRLSAAEHKRRQSPIVFKVSPKAFGMGRRWPVTHGFIS